MRPIQPPLDDHRCSLKRRAPGLFRLTAAVLAVMALQGGAAQAQSRGELLYNTNCIACHSTQMHWRSRRLATDWNSLEEQVRRWQQAASLGWRDEDIVEVARYLNERYYGFTPTITSGLLKATGLSPFAAGPRPAAPTDRP
ncbi:cytochrome c [Variovorax sp. Root434]|uniref:cytochrome c n=1 Tax=Variovorax sp. Root434 TaxID=1736536 RepID=UPI0012F91194|nr:cytochrome c [Variovorax sp. Root434]